MPKKTKKRAKPTGRIPVKIGGVTKYLVYY